jgi:glucose/arabinose dehydrogenase
MKRALVVLLAAVALGGCGGGGGSGSTAQDAAAVSAKPARVHGAKIRFAHVRVTVPSGNGGGAFNQPRTMVLPRGWHAEVWAKVPSARFETWTPQGDLLVAATGEGGIVELTPRANRSLPPARKILVSGLEPPQGMAFDNVDGHEVLYVAESDKIDRYDWNDGTLGARTIIVNNLPSGGSHPLKDVVVAPNHTVYADIGSDSNADPPSGTGIERATVISFNSMGGNVRYFARGIRNGDGLSFAPDGTLWTAVNERDDIAYPFHRAYGGVSDAYNQVIQAYVDNHPPDEVARLTPGRNLGWPYCDPDPDVRRGVAGTAYNYANMRFDDDAQTNPGGSGLNCAKLQPIQRGIPAHSAPLGFTFLQGSKLPKRWTAGALVGTHGSWDRQPPRPPGVLWLPWEARQKTLGPAITLVGGFQAANGSRWGRPVDAVPGPDGSLYVTDDTADAVYRITP